MRLRQPDSDAPTFILAVVRGRFLGSPVRTTSNGYTAMGCVSSREFHQGRLVSRRLRSLLGGIGKKQVQKKKLLDQVPEEQTISYADSSNEVRTLGEMLELEQQMDPEVINVSELMEGLSEEDEAAVTPPGSDSERIAEEAGLTTDASEASGVVTTEDILTTDASEAASGVVTTEDTSSASDCAVNNEESPRSPLNFDSQIQGRRKFTPRYGMAKHTTTLDTVVTTNTNTTTVRTFSFKLKSQSSNEQVTTPKLIIDSSSPLFKSDGESAPQEGQYTGVVFPPADDATSVEDEELLSAFECILEQLSSDDWLSTRASNADSFDPASPASTSGKHEISLYFLKNQENHQDCCTVRSILKGYGVQVEEKDISTHPDYRQELIHFIDESVPAALFINGRYIGGAEQLLELDKRGQLGLVLSAPADMCSCCGGMGDIPCLDCDGSRKLVTELGELRSCTYCSETGQVRCPLCS